MVTPYIIGLLIVGVAFATPAFAYAGDMPCPDKPPPGNFSHGKVGGVGVQIGALGISGTRERTKITNDVVIQAEGTSGYHDLVYYHQACLVILKLYPGDVRRQWAEMSLFRNTQFRPAASTHPAALPASSLSSLARCAVTGRCFDGDSPAATSQRPGQPPAGLFNVVSTQPAPVPATVFDSSVATAFEAPSIEGKRPVPTSDLAAETPQRAASSYEVHSEANRIPNCLGLACKGGITTCVSTPRMTYLAPVVVGKTLIPGLMVNMGDDTSCSTTF